MAQRSWSTIKDTPILPVIPKAISRYSTNPEQDSLYQSTRLHIPLIIENSPTGFTGIFYNM
jgi:hypothetical protein